MAQAAAAAHSASPHLTLQPIRISAVEPDLANMGVDPGLSREQLDRLFPEILDPPVEKQRRVYFAARGGDGGVFTSSSTASSVR